MCQTDFPEFLMVSFCYVVFLLVLLFSFLFWCCVSSQVSSLTHAMRATRGFTQGLRMQRTQCKENCLCKILHCACNASDTRL